jgi:hypothetical protein
MAHAAAADETSTRTSQVSLAEMPRFSFGVTLYEHLNKMPENPKP